MNLSDEFAQPESFDKSYYEYLEMKEQSEREKDEDQLLLFIQIGNDAAHTILTVTIYIYLLTITWKSRKLTIFNRLIVLFCICNVFYRIFENTFFSQIYLSNGVMIYFMWEVLRYFGISFRFLIIISALKGILASFCNATALALIAVIRRSILTAYKHVKGVMICLLIYGFISLLLSSAASSIIFVPYFVTEHWSFHIYYMIIPLNNANNVAGPVIVALVSFYYLNKSLKNMGVSKFRRRSERWFSNMLILQATIDFAAYAICGCLFELVNDKNNKDEQSKIVNNILIAQIPSWVGVIDAIIMYFAVRSFFQKRRTSMFTITAL